MSGCRIGKGYICIMKAALYLCLYFTRSKSVYVRCFFFDQLIMNFSNSLLIHPMVRVGTKRPALVAQSCQFLQIVLHVQGFR